MDDFKNTVSILSVALRFLSAASVGVFTGAMLTEGGVLVPYWRSLPPAQFLSWYAVNGQRLQGFFGPLTMVAGFMALGAAMVCLWEGHPGRWFSVIAAIVLLAVVSTFFLYFQKANASFATANIGTDNVAAELRRWTIWHWWRTGLSFVAFLAALLPLLRWK